MFLITSDLHRHLVKTRTAMRDTYRGALRDPVERVRVPAQDRGVSFGPGAWPVRDREGQPRTAPIETLTMSSDRTLAGSWDGRSRTGSRKKANPKRPEEVRVADSDGMFKTVQIRGLARSLVNQNVPPRALKTLAGA